MNSIASFSTTLLTSVLILVQLAGAAAATFTVNNANDSGAGSLRQAVLDSNAAAGSDTIVFDAAFFGTSRTIVLASAISLNPATGDSLTITGPGADLLTVSGNNVTRHFTVASGDTVFISGMRLSGGNESSGGSVSNAGIATLTGIVFAQNTSNRAGAVYNSGNGTTTGVLIIANCEFIGNTTTGTNINGDGGSAIGVNSGLVTITDSLITGGTTRGGGGGIRAGGIVNITNSTISNNTSGSSGNGDGGGGIYLSGQMTLTNCVVSGNTAGGETSGGGIKNEGQLTLIDTEVTGNFAEASGGGILHSATDPGNSFSVDNSTISYNTANSDNDTGGEGGGLYLNGVSATITNSTIHGNAANGSAAAAGNGGGLRVDQVLTMTNCTISGNTAGRDGAGIGTSGTSGAIVTITSSTIVNNRAVRDGGGIYRPSNTNPVNFRNTIVANNLDDGTAPNIFGVVVSQGYNLISNTTGAAFNPAPTDIIGVDPNLGFLQNNGGPTLTHAFLGASPAIDKGHSFGAIADQRGMPRPIDLAIPNKAGGDGADIGAFEAQAMAPTFVVTNDADSGPGSLRNALMQANANAQPDTIGFDAAFFATPRTIVLASEIEITADGTIPGQEMIIDGPGADLVTVSGNNAVRPFFIAPNASVVMSGMTIRNGNGVGQ